MKEWQVVRRAAVDGTTLRVLKVAAYYFCTICISFYASPNQIASLFIYLETLKGMFIVFMLQVAFMTKQYIVRSL